jgi:hypothetical protein
MDREELAAHIMCAQSTKGAVGFDFCFDLADRFLAYAAKQREPKACEIDAPPTQSTCQHDLSEYVWIDGAKLYHCKICWPRASEKSEPPKPACEHPDGGNATTYCSKCKRIVIADSEPPKPDRVAREWWVRYPKPDEDVLCVGSRYECAPEVWPDAKVHKTIFEHDEWIKVREILPGDGK